jgi:hypothetical protein
VSEPLFRQYTVIALRKQQLWAEDARGDVLRAWKPEQAGVRLGARVRIYGDGNLEINGWHDPESGQAVDLRRFDGRVDAEPRSVVCASRCSIVWEAPAGAAVLEAEHGCLECGGPLVLSLPGGLGAGRRAPARRGPSRGGPPHPGRGGT